MDVDASFAEYVSVRWSTLYRLATVLVGPADADDLAEAALVRAYTSWRQVQEDPSTDAAVKKILVNTAVKTGKENGVRAGAEDGLLAPGAVRGDSDELWARISTLPPRERAVVVLLYYEDLTESEIARVLGCSIRTVKAHAYAALANHIDLADFTTHDLHDELVWRADEADVPPPPVGSLLARGHRARRGRVRRALAWTAAGAAAVVIGGMLVSVADEPDSGGPEPPRPTPSPPALPGSLANLPEGDPPQIAFSSRRTLHLHGREVALSGRPSAIAQTPTHVFVAYPSGRVEQVDIDTLAVETVTDSAAGSVVTGPDGDHVAWLASGTGQARVVLRSVDDGGAGSDVDEQTFPATPTCCDNPFVVNGLTRSGELVGSLPASSQAWVWDTREDQGTEDDVTAIEGLGNGVVHDVTPTEVVVHHPPFHFGAGKLQGGFFLVTTEVQARSVDFWDPLGRRAVYVDRAGETHVSVRSPRRRGRAGGDVRLVLPVLDAGFSGVTWEDPDHVLLDVLDDVVPQGALVRCDVESGACEIAARFDGPHLVAR